ncbi:MAG: flagellar filament capping protein FliD, partial [Halioglobus sp.]|nr:flagellar filament capping protein FliD [Halioglobus sp.]
ISTPENVANDVIEGIDLTLKDVSGATPINVSVSEDTEALKELITGFIDGFNSFVTTTNALTAFDVASGTGGPLQGDFSVRSISGQVRQVLTNAVEGFDGPFSNLSELGIATQVDGTLAINDATLNTVIEDNFDDIVGLFAAVGLPSDSSIDYLSSTEDTVVGSYAVDITQAATQGQYTGSNVRFTGGTLDIDDRNDEFTIQVDGVTSGNITLTQGTYTSGEDVAAEVQSRINGDANLLGAGIRVDVAYVGGNLEITSERYGADSSVNITAVDQRSSQELGLSVANGVAGTDLAGTIGGQPAIASGQILTGAPGSPADGLRIRVNGEAVGSRGQVDFSRGIAYQLDALISGFLENDGILDARTDSLQERANDLDDDRDQLEFRMERLEARYRAQFTALDTLLSQLQTTSAFLTQQLSSLPGAGLNNNNN